ncbi:transmembrane protein 17-like [Sitophilus oryzae]|uniref:Transmembrane protein 17-like n=1 Tax=Sitophilus oryzae TaxID=7048 RepID=A0A6J2X640_SITOR|nr:transmembrane protein 17-like [Sitophilus oryzae]
MEWKETVTALSENVFPGIAYKVERQTEGLEIKSNLPLQVSTYFNVVFVPVWINILLISVVDNFHNFDQLKQFLFITIISTIIFVEVLRLYMVYEGNLNDKIPELACFWMLSLFLQLPLQGILLFTPYFQLDVLEIICQTVMMILLLFQILFGYVALKYTASQQAIFYKIMKLNNEIPSKRTSAKNENKKTEQ